MTKEGFLQSLRPGNESYEHYILKQIGKRWLYDKGLRNIGTEVFLDSERESIYGKKSTVDVVGVHQKTTYKWSKDRTFTDIQRVVSAEGVLDKVTVNYLKKYPNKVEDFLYSDRKDVHTLLTILNDHEYSVKEFIVEMKKRKEINSTLYTLEAKASVSDFKNGFSVAGDYSYVIVPEGLIGKDLVPNGIGLLEVDIERAVTDKDYKGSIKVSKRVKKMVDPKFIDRDGNIHELYRESEMADIITRISVRNANENHYWNPHLM